MRRLAFLGLVAVAIGVCLDGFWFSQGSGWIGCEKWSGAGAGVYSDQQNEMRRRGLYAEEKGVRAHTGSTLVERWKGTVRAHRLVFDMANLDSK